MRGRNPTEGALKSFTRCYVRMNETENVKGRT